MSNVITMYRKNAIGIGSWSIRSEGSTIHIQHSTTLHSAMVSHEEEVKEGLQGRTIAEQVNMRIESRISRMKDKGYKTTIEEATKGVTNQLGLDAPMLAHPMKRVKSIDTRGAVLQPKYNGHRCLVTMSDGELVAYSRQGKIIDSIEHILEPLKAHMSEGLTLDGELYCHGYPLQTLASWIKRKQDSTKLLVYNVYDLIDGATYQDRRVMLEPFGDLSESIKLADTWDYVSDEQMGALFKTVRADGYEGLMLRLNNRGYEVGKRSNSLIKIKEFLDAEFECVDIIPSADGWGICVLKTPGGLTFKTSAPGTLEEKRDQLDNKESYIGRMLTVEFAELTNDGIPFHCSALQWRVDI